MSRFHSAIVGASLSNKHGYTQRTTPGHFTVMDEEAQPIRVHNGLATFTTREQADWCAELMNTAFYMGRERLQDELRSLLNIPPPLGTTDYD